MGYIHRMKLLAIIASIALTGCQPKAQKFVLISPSDSMQTIIRLNTDTGETWILDHRAGPMGTWGPVREPGPDTPR